MMSDSAATRSKFIENFQRHPRLQGFEAPPRPQAFEAPTKAALLKTSLKGKGATALHIPKPATATPVDPFNIF
jgi:hypothetical protein